MSTTPTTTDATTWALDREIVLVRVLDAPREAVFAAWTDADAFCEWFGPDGFTCTVREMDVRNGGRARFDMTSGDGTVFTNRFDYVAILPSERLVMDHGSDTDNDPARFRVTVSFDEQADGKTVLTLRQLHPTVEQRDGGIGFGAVELGLQTMQKLAASSRSRLTQDTDEWPPTTAGLRERDTQLSTKGRPADASGQSRTESAGIRTRRASTKPRNRTRPRSDHQPAI